VALSPRIIFRLVSFSTKFESASLNPVRCLEAPLSINQTSRVSGGDAVERADTRINSFLLLSTTLDSSYLEFLDLLKGCPFPLRSEGAFIFPWKLLFLPFLFELLL